MQQLASLHLMIRRLPSLCARERHNRPCFAFHQVQSPILIMGIESVSIVCVLSMFHSALKTFHSSQSILILSHVAIFVQRLHETCFPPQLQSLATRDTTLPCVRKRSGSSRQPQLRTLVAVTYRLYDPKINITACCNGKPVQEQLIA